MEWIPLTTSEELDQIALDSQTEPVLVFKHSTRCSISSMMLSKLERNWNDQKLNLKVKTYLLDLISYRTLSDQIEQKWGVRHESPQMMVWRDGKLVYHTSHMGITFDSIQKVINQ